MKLSVHLVVPDASAAMDWYAMAFGAQERSRIPLPGGTVMVVEMQLGDAVVHVASEFPDAGIVSPLSIGGTATVLQLNVEDVDAAIPVISVAEVRGAGVAAAQPPKARAAAATISS